MSGIGKRVGFRNLAILAVLGLLAGIVVAVLPNSAQAATNDADDDGYTSVASGGTDCNDTNPLIHPNSSTSYDIPDNSFTDTDCDGIDGNGTTAIKESTSQTSSGLQTDINTICADGTKTGNAKRQILMAGPVTYTGISVPSSCTGLVLAGGYNSTWTTRTTGSNTVTFTGAGTGLTVDTATGVVLNNVTISGTTGGTPLATGLKQYDYTGRNFETYSSVTDATQINYDNTGTSPTDYARRYQGYIVPSASGTMTLSAVANDGVRVWFNGSVVIDSWADVTTGTTTTTTSASQSMTAGTAYPIQYEWYQNTGTAHAELKWNLNGGGSVTVPATAFRMPTAASTYGLLVLNSASVDLQRVTTTAAAGSPGPTTPAATANRGNGSVGGNGTDGANCGISGCPADRPGGTSGAGATLKAGETSTPSGSARNGGVGGIGYSGNTTGQGGAKGVDTASGGGSGGAGGGGTSAVVCADATGGSGGGGSATAGAAGAQGSGGTNSGQGTQTGAAYVGNSGLGGGTGGTGHGGGGAGAGGGAGGGCGYSDVGASGGGGGGGAGGGYGGGGGFAGGGSFGIWNSSSTVVVDAASSATSNSGGTGGIGGGGATGGTGGGGGNGGRCDLNQEMGAGGGGGGGSGGGGGAGGSSGAGGPSYAIYSAGGKTRDLGAAKTNGSGGTASSAGAAGNGGTAGTAGTKGGTYGSGGGCGSNSSNGTAGTVGTAGAAGAAGAAGLSGTTNTLTNAVPDLSVAVSGVPASMTAGQASSFTVTVTNNGGSASTTSPTVSVPLAAGMAFDSGGSTGGCTGSGSPVTVSCTLASIAQNGGTAAKTISVIPANTPVGSGGPGGYVGFTATVGTDTGETHTFDNDSRAVGPTLATATRIDKWADLTVSSASSPNNFRVGVDNTFTVNASNSGGKSTASGSTLTITMPTGVKYKNATGTGWSCPDNSSSPSAGPIACTRAAGDGVAALPALTVTVQPQPDGVGSPSTSFATSVTEDTNTGNNSLSKSVVTGHGVQGDFLAQVTNGFTTDKYTVHVELRSFPSGSESDRLRVQIKTNPGNATLYDDTQTYTAGTLAGYFAVNGTNSSQCTPATPSPGGVCYNFSAPTAPKVRALTMNTFTMAGSVTVKLNVLPLFATSFTGSIQIKDGANPPGSATYWVYPMFNPSTTGFYTG